jgi:hypothetical protein
VEELAEDGRRGSTPLLPGGPTSSAAGAVADGRRGCALTVDRGPCRGRTAGELAGGGACLCSREAPPPLLLERSRTAGGCAGSLAGVADGRRVCGRRGSRTTGGDEAPARYVDVESGDGFDLRTIVEKK